MTRMTGPDCAVMCNLINIHTYIHTYMHTYIHTCIHTYIHPLGGSMRVAYNDSDDRAGLRGYVQFNKYTYIHTYIPLTVHKAPELTKLQAASYVGVR